MIRISQLKLPYDQSKEALQEKIAKTLKLNGEFSYELRRQSLDARHPDDKLFVYAVDVMVKDEKKVMRKMINHNNITLINEAPFSLPAPGSGILKERPVIVGSGPAGLFCAWYLAYAGYRPLVLERGLDVDSRTHKVEEFWKSGVLDPECNVQFGEGGAGTFSDGKLNTMVKDPHGLSREVMKRFIAAGADPAIAWQQKPHIGTDVLRGIIRSMRQEIEEMGGTFRFSSRLTALTIRNGRVEEIHINDSETLPVEVLVLALGHSARDTFRMLKQRNVSMQPKAFAVGVRIQHLQETINLSQYHSAFDPILGPASYKVTHTASSGRGVYSFCMCPGGYVVNASSEPEMLAVNGMSYHDRSGSNANSALIVSVDPSDFEHPDDPLSGIEFQRKLEKAAFIAGKGSVPVQRFADFEAGRISSGFGKIRPAIKGSWDMADLGTVLPLFIRDSLTEGIHAFSGKIAGFDDGDALLCGVESRTSSPLRIPRNQEFMASAEGIYPCGEGAGYAGGITSAAMDGIRTACAVISKYKGIFCS